MALTRPVRGVLSAICWILAVASGLFTAAAFAGGGVLCQTGRRAACKPETWLLVLGVVAMIGFGVAGARLYKPKPKRETRFPWEYPH